MNKQQLFVKHHWASTIALGLVVILSVSFGVVVEDTHLFKKSDGQVMGVATTQDEDSQSSLVVDYQNQLKYLINNYLKQRSTYQAQSQDWLFLINSTKYKLMHLSTPASYQDLTLKLVNLLETEEQAVFQASQSGLDKANNKWQEILAQYYWLD